MTGTDVPAPSVTAREQELRRAVRAAQTPAADLFGDARTLAAEDALELATADEAVRTSLGGGLRGRLMSPSAVRGHVAEIEQAVQLSGRPAYEEFGHPLALAREIAAADRPARIRRWWTAVTAGTAWPLAIAAFLLVGRTWGALTIPAALFLALGAAVALSTAWANRPWAAHP